MSNLTNFIQTNINYLNNIQSYHWQTESYSEHESLGEYYTNFNKLNDEFVETLQGKSNERIKFSAELRPGILNYADVEIVKSEVQKTADRINEINKEVDGQIDLQSILEDMLLSTNQLLYHLSLK
jgi:DNA-binding ferritin-like protein